MNIDTIKLELVELILKIDNPQLITQLIKLLRKEEMDFWDVISDEEKNEIFLGVKELESGKKYSYESVVDKYRNK